MFGSGVLRLAPLVKVHYLAVVAETFPELLPRYERAYPGTNAPPAYLAAIERRVARIRARYRFPEDVMRTKGVPLRAPGQQRAASVTTTSQLSLGLELAPGAP